MRKVKLNGTRRGKSRLSRAARRVRDELVACLVGRGIRNKGVVLKHRYWKDRLTGRWHGVELLVPQLKLGINIDRELDAVGRSCLAIHGIKVVQVRREETFDCRELVRELVRRRRKELASRPRTGKVIKAEYRELVDEYLSRGGKIRKYDSKGRLVVEE